MGILKKHKVNTFFLSMMILAILLCCDLQVQAAQEGDYSYIVRDGKAEITDYTGAGGDVAIPGTLGGFPVTSIGDYAFWYCEGLTNINIPEGISSIGDGAFYGCHGLTSINIPEGVSSIGGDAAFGGCTSLTNITVAVNNLTYSSKDGLLYNKTGTTLMACPGGLTSVNIPEGVSSIGDAAFGGCAGLTSINIPEGISSIGDIAFGGCTSLSNIIVAVDNLTYSSKDGLLYNKTGTTLMACPGGLTSINIPEGVTSIGDYAFSSCDGLTSINIPEGVTTIGDRAFWYCEGLSSINISEDLISIGDGAFGHCTGLSEVSIPESVSSIGDDAFGYCLALTSITFNSAATEIYDSEDTIPATTTIIGYDPSTAKDYATKYNRAFEIIGSPPAVNIDTTGMIEFTTTSSTAVSSSKEWTIKLSGLINENSIANNIYVANSQGVQQETTCTVTNVDGASQIKVVPTNGYTPGTYTLFIRDIESVNGSKIKNQVFLRFSVTNS